MSQLDALSCCELLHDSFQDLVELQVCLDGAHGALVDERHGLDGAAQALPAVAVGLGFLRCVEDGLHVGEVMDCLGVADCHVLLLELVADGLIGRSRCLGRSGLEGHNVLCAEGGENARGNKGNYARRDSAEDVRHGEHDHTPCQHRLAAHLVANGTEEQ